MAETYHIGRTDGDAREQTTAQGGEKGPSSVDATPTQPSHTYADPDKGAVPPDDTRLQGKPSLAADEAASRAPSTRDEKTR